MPSTKQLRLSDPVIIKNRMKEFTGRKINIVLADNRVIVGELEQADASGISLINMRLKKMRYSYNEVSEVYFDVLV